MNIMQGNKYTNWINQTIGNHLDDFVNHPEVFKRSYWPRVIINTLVVLSLLVFFEHLNNTIEPRSGITLFSLIFFVLIIGQTVCDVLIRIGEHNNYTYIGLHLFVALGVISAFFMSSMV